MVHPDALKRVQENLRQLQQELATLADELVHLTGEAHKGATCLLDRVSQELRRLETAWQRLADQPEPGQADVDGLNKKISGAQAELHRLKLRRNYRRRYTLLQENLARQQMALTPDQLQPMIQPHVGQLEAQIQTMEAKGQLAENEQKLLGIHRRNLVLYRQMLAGERPYAPLPLLSELMDLEQTLNEIDDELKHIN